MTRANDPPSEALLPAAVETWLARAAARPERVDPLTGDASDRRYFRLSWAGGRTTVLALQSAPFSVADLPFAQVTALFDSIGVPVPAIRSAAGDLGILELEDLGDASLQSVIETATREQRGRLYGDAVALIVRIQEGGASAVDRSTPPFGLAFDVEKLTWELDFFLTHYVEAYRAARLPATARQALRAEFRVLASVLAEEPRVLCHRDFHSRNLMVRDGSLVVIDHQDARMGPETYDLVSLLRDAYVEIDDAMASAMIDRFLALKPSTDRATFGRRFDTMALQRSLKALGTFGYQATSRQNPAYTDSMPGPLAVSREILQREARFGRLREILAAFVPEVG